MRFPYRSFRRQRLISAVPSAPSTTALPMMPYMWKLWKRNISWIRYQLMTSDLVKRMPKKTPSRMNLSCFTGPGCGA